MSLYAVLLAINLWRHEMWRDELQAWLLARDSPTLLALFHNIVYERHPALWNVLLWLLTRFTREPAAMQVLHWAFATAAVALFVRRAPLPLDLRLLFPLGYFWLYEYGTLSRNYVLGVLFTFAFCALLARRRRSYLPLAAALFLLCQTSVYGLVLAGTFTAALAAEALAERALGAREARDVVGSLALVAAGAALSLVQIMPPAKLVRLVAATPAARTTMPVEQVSEAIATLWRTYVPLPAPGVHFWNTNLLDLAGAAHVLQPSLALLLIALSACLFRTLRARLAYLLGTLALLAFTWGWFFGRLRHYGHLWLLFVACLWMEASHRAGAQAGEAPPAGRIAGARRSLITALFAAQAVAGLWASAVDWRHPFSASRAAARKLRESLPADAIVLGDLDYATMPVAAYLDRPLWYPSRGGFGTFVEWGKRRSDFDPRATVRAAVRLHEEERRPVVLLLSYPLDLRGGAFERVAAFPESIVTDERYVLYAVGVTPGGH